MFGSKADTAGLWSSGSARLHLKLAPSFSHGIRGLVVIFFSVLGIS